MSRVSRVRRPRWLPVAWLAALLGPAAAAVGAHASRASAAPAASNAPAAADRADSVAFEAPAECPSAEAFVAKVGERGERAGRAARVVHEPDARKARYRVRVVRAGRGFRGTLTIVDEAGAHDRAVDGGTCVEVVDALALVTAMALEAPPEPEPPLSASASASIAPSAPSASTTSPAASSAPAASSSLAPGGLDGAVGVNLPPPAKRPIREGAEVRWAIGGDFALVGLDGAVPRGGDLYVEAAGDGSRGFAPALRAGAGALWASPDVPGGGTLGLRWTTFDLDACGVRVLAGQIRVDACASVQIGALHASPSASVQAAASALRPWLSLGGTLRGQLAVGAGFYLEAHGGLRAPITRDRFGLGDGTEVYRAAAVTLVGGLGLGLHFP